jgi:hypothetical protein
MIFPGTSSVASTIIPATRSVEPCHIVGHWHWQTDIAPCSHPIFQQRKIHLRHSLICVPEDEKGFKLNNSNYGFSARGQERSIYR